MWTFTGWVLRAIVFGGGKINYLIIHSHLFAAALEGVGTADFISSSLVLAGKRFEEFSRLETYEELMGTSLWQRPDLYLSNSPIMHAGEVTSPLLILHCKADESVPWDQGGEFLRRFAAWGKRSGCCNMMRRPTAWVTRKTRRILPSGSRSFLIMVKRERSRL